MRFLLKLGRLYIKNCNVAQCSLTAVEKKPVLFIKNKIMLEKKPVLDFKLKIIVILFQW